MRDLASFWEEKCYNARQSGVVLSIFGSCDCGGKKGRGLGSFSCVLRLCCGQFFSKSMVSVDSFHHKGEFCERK